MFKHCGEGDLAPIPADPSFGRTFSLVPASENSLTNGQSRRVAVSPRVGVSPLGRIRWPRSRRPALQLLRALKFDLSFFRLMRLFVKPCQLVVNRSIFRIQAFCFFQFTLSLAHPVGP